MTDDYYDRYDSFREDGDIKVVPFLEIDDASTDLFITFNRGTMRLDTLSYKYYGDANYSWLLLQANPHLGSLEFRIPNGVQFRIPYPLSSALSRYESAYQAYITENGES